MLRIFKEEREKDMQEHEVTREQGTARGVLLRTNFRKCFAVSHSNKRMIPTPSVAAFTCFSADIESGNGY
jgi:hypothetical protein